MAVIKTDCPKEMKDKFKALSKKLGETESSLIRKAAIIMMESDPKKLREKLSS